MKKFGSKDLQMHNIFLLLCTCSPSCVIHVVIIKNGVFRIPLPSECLFNDIFTTLSTFFQPIFDFCFIFWCALPFIPSFPTEKKIGFRWFILAIFSPILYMVLAPWEHVSMCHNVCRLCRYTKYLTCWACSLSDTDFILNCPFLKRHRLRPWLYTFTLFFRYLETDLSGFWCLFCLSLLSRELSAFSFHMFS